MGYFMIGWNEGMDGWARRTRLLFYPMVIITLIPPII